MNGRVIIDCDGYERFAGENRGVVVTRRVPYRREPRIDPPPRDQLPYFKQRCGCAACRAWVAEGSGHDELHPFANFDELHPTADPAPNNSIYYLVLARTVGGFILDERRWAHFDVACLRDIVFDRDAFKYLVLDEEVKTTVKSLIGKYAAAAAATTSSSSSSAPRPGGGGQVSPWPSDFVKNKGQGRIFLLHGSPGTGKTATCESVSELTRRPLLSLTSGDLGAGSAAAVEHNLAYFLQLGERFGALVLLDEADVYLEARRVRDIQRNGLVAVFLRALEYYRGLLFLTTNRAAAFDGALTSRVHVALHYRPLADADRETIWLNAFARLERESRGRVRVSVPTREYAYNAADVRALRWNGREIRNALQTAVALAEAEAAMEREDREEGDEEKGAGGVVGAGREEEDEEEETPVVEVTDKHLRAVVNMSRGFKTFMREKRRQRNADQLEDGEEEEEHGQENDKDDEDIEDSIVKHELLMAGNPSGLPVSYGFH
jgi:hypothetical protein